MKLFALRARRQASERERARARARPPARPLARSRELVVGTFYSIMFYESDLLTRAIPGREKNVFSTDPRFVAVSVELGGDARIGNRLSGLLNDRQCFRLYTNIRESEASLIHTRIPHRAMRNSTCNVSVSNGD